MISPILSQREDGVEQILPTPSSLLGLSTSQAGSVLDPIQTRPAGVGWMSKELETDRQH